ncbi:MAG TPA: hypothetical protein VF386_00475, partial [Usitatibacter sp.]
MNEDFESVFAASEDIKKLMQGVYNTFIEKFGFQKMTIPALDLDPHRTKLQLLVMQTEAFVKDPVNVVVKEKHFVVKNFYATLVKEARRNFGDAKTQTERWVQAVVLPLEVQIKDHKAQLQSRLDNLAKINEKTTSINEQMALLKGSEAELRKQREMIEGLIQRVSQHEARASLAESPAPLGTPEKAVPVELMQTTRMATFDTPRPAPKPAPAAAPAKPAPAKAPEAPLISDDAFAQFGKPAAPAFDPMKTQKMAADPQSTQRLGTADPNRTQRLDAGGPQSTQRIPVPDPQSTQRLPANHPESTQRLDGPDPQRTQRMDAQPPEKARAAAEGEKTMKIQKLDPSYRPPETTQKADPSNPPTEPLPEPSVDAEATQRIDDSIWRLQEAKRILQGITPK